MSRQAGVSLLRSKGGAIPAFYSQLTYRSGILSPCVAVKRKEYEPRAGHPSLPFGYGALLVACLASLLDELS